MEKWTPEKIKEFRKAHKLTQKGLAILLGVSENSVYYWEGGERNPSATTKILLSKIEEELTKKRKGVKHGKRNL